MDVFDRIEPAHAAFIAKQPVFFVATAAAGAHINLSPKGMDSFRVLDETTVGYRDVGGSGNETNAHLVADGRITILFCAFEQPALILRLYGTGRIVLPGDDDWPGLAERFVPLPGTRQIFVVAVERVQTSCGWGVPLMTLERERETLSAYHLKHSGGAVVLAEDAVRESIDGLPTRVTRG